MSDDLRLAMKLQAHYNAEGASPPPESTPAPYKKPRLQGEPVLDRTALEADEQYARYVAGLSNDTDSTLLITSLSEADDLKFARELQAKFDSEASRTPQPELSAASEREMIASYGSAVLKLRCFTCKCPLMPNVGSVDELNAIWSGRKHASSVLTCSACRTWTCCGCGGPPKAVHRRNVEGWSVTFCCDEGRLFLLWSLLCSVKHSTSSKTAAPISMSPSRTQRPGSFRKSGVGYGDDLHVRHRKGRDRPIEMKRDVDPTDDPTRRLLATLAALLPSWKNGAQFDNDAPPVLEGMLRRSAVMEKAAELLRNDSVEEIARRGDLYAALIEFLDVLARHPATARVLYDDRAPRSESYDLVTLSFSASHLPPKRESAEKNQSLAKIMQNLRVQADTFLKQYRMHWADTYEDSHSELAYNLSTEIAELASFVEANDSRKIVKQPEVRSDEQDNREWHREHCVDDVPDEHILEGYHYHGRSEKLQTVPRGRMKKLMLELAALRTSLPEGIYVRHSSSRLDVIKVMIVGPAGTPYENGLFEFDLFCPSNYPHEPPKMQFKTTGKGIAHFNPNLYANGKGTRFEPLDTADLA
jgi:baculoviral IAP repeat-containing protein 6